MCPATTDRAANSNEALATVARKARSGSETRQRTAAVRIRFTPEERLQIEEAASKAGLTLASFGRVQMIGGKPPRSARRPPLEREAAARLLAALGKIGSNLNQIAHAHHLGQAGRTEIAEAIEEAKKFKALLRGFLGRQD